MLILYVEAIQLLQQIYKFARCEGSVQVMFRLFSSSGSERYERTHKTDAISTGLWRRKL